MQCQKGITAYVSIIHFWICENGCLDLWEWEVDRHFEQAFTAQNNVTLPLSLKWEFRGNAVSILRK